MNRYTFLLYLSTYYAILYYTILYYTILYYTILYYTIPYYTTLYCTIIYHNILYYSILYYTILSVLVSSCPKLVLPENSVIVRGEKSTYAYGDRIFINCEDGYFRMGTSVMYCGILGWQTPTRRPSQCLREYFHP